MKPDDLKELIDAVLVKVRKETAEKFAKMLEVNLLNNTVVDDDCTLEDFEFDGEEIREAIKDCLKQFGVEVEE